MLDAIIIVITLEVYRKQSLKINADTSLIHIICI